MTNPKAGAPQCLVDDCTAVQVARDWCEKHYRRWLKSGDPLKVGRRGPKPSGQPPKLPPHGQRSRYCKGCRCELCSEAARVYNQKAICVDCGKPCQPSKPKGDWKPPADPRCRACGVGVRPKTFCACGSEISPGAKRCKSCVSRGATRKRQSRPIDPQVRLSSGPWRRLRAQVLAEEPRCQIRTRYCTGKSETADHIIPRVVRPDLTWTRENLRGACHACNRAIARRQIAAARQGLDPQGVKLREVIPQPRIALPPSQRKPRIPKLPVLYRRCIICDDWSVNASCPGECSMEWFARKTRDNYRKKVGIPWNHRQPTTRHGRRDRRALDVGLDLGVQELNSPSR